MPKFPLDEDTDSFSFIKQLSAFDDVKLVDYNYDIETINEFSNLDGFDIVKH